MMKATRRNVIYWVLKVISIIISFLFPVIAICDKFPVWEDSYGLGRSIGTGGLLITFVLFAIFRRTVFDFLEERLKLKHAPPITVWIVMLIIAYVLLYICKFLTDIILVFWMGFLGCGLGTILTMVSELCFGKENNEGT